MLYILWILYNRRKNTMEQSCHNKKSENGVLMALKISWWQLNSGIRYKGLDDRIIALTQSISFSRAVRSRGQYVYWNFLCCGRKSIWGFSFIGVRAGQKWIGDGGESGGVWRGVLGNLKRLADTWSRRMGFWMGRWFWRKIDGAQNRLDWNSSCWGSEERRKFWHGLKRRSWRSSRRSTLAIESWWKLNGFCSWGNGSQWNGELRTCKLWKMSHEKVLTLGKESSIGPGDHFPTRCKPFAEVWFIRGLG